MEYVAFVVDRDGIHPSPRKVQTIHKVQVPENPTELKSLLGMVNLLPQIYSRQPTLAHPLNRLFAENIPWEWTIQLAAYTYDIEYRASKYHGNADALSRLPRKTTEEVDDWSVEGDQVNRVLHPLSLAKSERLQEAIQSFHVSYIMSCMVDQ